SNGLICFNPDQINTDGDSLGDACDPDDDNDNIFDDTPDICPDTLDGTNVDTTNGCPDLDYDGYSTERGDCDETADTINLFALEICTDNADNDCNQLTDCQDSSCSNNIDCLINNIGQSVQTLEETYPTTLPPLDERIKFISAIGRFVSKVFQ
ncbi:hypothetical protein HYU21_04495, partial [Candidatus Woesearchaeota archaeon]|nr:hypothetical protein [Candidatus Woesearchaeota archaeon]